MLARGAEPPGTPAIGGWRWWFAAPRNPAIDARCWSFASCAWGWRWWFGAWNPRYWVAGVGDSLGRLGLGSCVLVHDVCGGVCET